MLSDRRLSYRLTYVLPATATTVLLLLLLLLLLRLLLLLLLLWLCLPAANCLLLQCLQTLQTDRQTHSANQTRQEVAQRAPPAVLLLHCSTHTPTAKRKTLYRERYKSE